ncbi:MAG TPA: hypothetical protein VFW01_08990, partial [bacterium]|nr:hypothetical protein [bacterium]
VRLGMSAADVTAVLGQPTPGQGGEVSFPRLGVSVAFQDGTAVRLGTTNPQFRTVSGAGVGIRLDDLPRLVGDFPLAVTIAGSDTSVLSPYRGIGFVFHGGRAVEAFVVARIPPGQSVAPGSLTLWTQSRVPVPSVSVQPGTPLLPPASTPTAPALVALRNVSAVVDAAKGLFRVSGEIVNVSSIAVDRATVVTTFIKSSGDEIRKQVVLPQPVAAGSSAAFTVDTPLLQTIVGGDLVVRYAVDATAGGGGPPIVHEAFTVPVDTYAELAQGQVKVDVQFGPPSNTTRAPRVQVLVSIGGTGSIPQSWVRDVVAEIPFQGGVQQVDLQPGQTVTILVPPVLVGGILCVGTPQIVEKPRPHLVTFCFPGTTTSPSLLGVPVVRSVTLGMP